MVPLWLVHFKFDYFFQIGQTLHHLVHAVFTVCYFGRNRYLEAIQNLARHFKWRIVWGQKVRDGAATQQSRCARRCVSARPSEWRRRDAQCQANATPASTSLTFSLPLTLSFSPLPPLTHSRVSLRVFSERLFIVSVDIAVCV